MASNARCFGVSAFGSSPARTHALNYKYNICIVGIVWSTTHLRCLPFSGCLYMCVERVHAIQTTQVVCGKNLIKITVLLLREYYTSEQEKEKRKNKTKRNSFSFRRNDKRARSGYCCKIMCGISCAMPFTRGRKIFSLFVFLFFFFFFIFVHIQHRTLTHASHTLCVFTFAFHVWSRNNFLSLRTAPCARCDIIKFYKIQFCLMNIVKMWCTRI